jgi:parvulin-like peptidyl-prolyl isomerase
MPTKANITNKKHVAHAEIVRRQSLAIKYTAVAIIAAVVLYVGYSVLANTVLMRYRSVATVNGERITAGEFQGRVKIERVQAINQFMQYYQLAQAFGSQDPLNDPMFGQFLQNSYFELIDATAFGGKILDNLIDERLIRQEAEKMGITVSEAEVETYIREKFQYYENGTPTPTLTMAAPVLPTSNPTQLAFLPPTATATLEPTTAPSATPDLTATATPTLAPTLTATATLALPTELPTATATPYTLEGFKESYAETIKSVQEESGLSEAEFRALYTNLLFRERVKAEVVKDAKPVEDQVWAQHILVKTEEEAKAVLARLEAGEDWNKLAAELSQDTSNALQGGSLDWFGPGSMVPEFEAAAYTLTKPGEISAPVQSEFGWHVIRLVDRAERPLNADQFAQLKERVFREWLDKLREAADIQKFDLWQEIVPTEPVLPL